MFQRTKSTLAVIVVVIVALAASLFAGAGTAEAQTSYQRCLYQTNGCSSSWAAPAGVYTMNGGYAVSPLEHSRGYGYRFQYGTPLSWGYLRAASVLANR